jgi:Zn-dependent M28 family amino/carboxypeptidase
MRLVHSNKVEPGKRAEELVSLLETIREGQLREWVERIAVPRHFVIEAEQNRATAKWLMELLAGWGYDVKEQGPHANVVAKTKMRPRESELILVGAHYDTVPECPGADDNASAVAAMLGCAAACAMWRPVLPVVFVAFNREEEHLKGSRDFVETFLPDADFRVRCAHVLEMVGYAKHESGTQKVPTALPIRIPDKGDFLGLLANGLSADNMDMAVQSARTYLPQFPVIGLKVQLGVERVFPVLARSDHVPFWEKEIPAVMWTDTSEFRNPHYHQHTDTPDTLDYDFLKRVTQVLTAAVVEAATEMLR